MEHRIVHNRAFWIVGFKKRITLQYEGINPQMNSLYERLTPECIAAMKELCDIEPYGMLSVSTNFSERTTEGTELDQYVGVASTRQPPGGYESLWVEASDWAVFTVAGAFPQAIQDMWARIFAEWLPSSNYELAQGPEILWHESPDLSKPDVKSEIWIPVRQRS